MLEAKHQNYDNVIHLLKVNTIQNRFSKRHFKQQAFPYIKHNFQNNSTGNQDFII